MPLPISPAPASLTRSEVAPVARHRPPRRPRPRRVRWLAGPDRVAHAYLAALTEPACDSVPGIGAERHAWPSSVRCGGCGAIVTALEAEQR